MLDLLQLALDDADQADLVRSGEVAISGGTAGFVAAATSGGRVGLPSRELEPSWPDWLTAT